MGGWPWRPLGCRKTMGNPGWEGAVGTVGGRTAMGTPRRVAMGILGRKVAMGTPEGWRL